jgi:hypothetical protein
MSHLAAVYLAAAISNPTVTLPAHPPSGECIIIGYSANEDNNVTITAQGGSKIPKLFSIPIYIKNHAPIKLQYDEITNSWKEGCDDKH